MNYIDHRPEFVKPVAALSEEDALRAGLIDKKIVVDPIIDPAAAAAQRSGAQGRMNFSMACPSALTPRDDRLAWLKGSVQRGISFLQSQPNYNKWSTSARILQGIIDDAVESGLSTAHVNHIKRQAKEIIATIGANMNPDCKFVEEDSESAEIEAIASYLNKKNKRWWRGNTFPVQKIKDVLQYALIGPGYLAPVWKNEIFGSNTADVDFKVYSAEDVYLDQGTEDWDEQQAYAVTLYERVPTIRLRQNWPEQSQWIYPSTMGMDEIGQKAKGTEANNRVSSTVSQNAIMALQAGNDGISSPKTEGHRQVIRSKMSAAGTFFTDLYFTYIADSSFNTTGKIVKASEITETDGSHLPDLRRDYMVPPVGAAVNIKGTGEEEDAKIYPSNQCRLYPSRRLIIWTPDHILYDGPSFYHHGMVPIVKFQLDPNVWSYGGGNLIEDVRRLSSSFNTMLRGWVDALNVRLQPPVEYDELEVAPGVLEKLNLRKAGIWLKRKANSLVKRAIEPLLPYQHYEVANQVLPYLQFALDRMNHTLGTEDFSSLARLQQLPDAEGIEKIMAANGPLMSDYASNLEQSLTKVGYQLMWMWLQFDTTARKLETQGVSDLLMSEFDSSIGDMIPGVIQSGDDLVNSSFFYRLRAIAKKITYKITPQSVFDVADWKKRMVMYQFYREGLFPISSQTIAERFGIEDFGEIPGKTEYEKWINEKKARTMFEAGLGAQTLQTQMVAQGIGQVQGQTAAAVAMQQLQQGMQEGMVDPNMAIMVINAMLQQGASELKPPKVDMMGLMSPGVGRPPTGQKAPDLEFKSNGDGTRRGTITES